MEDEEWRRGSLFPVVVRVRCDPESTVKGQFFQNVMHVALNSVCRQIHSFCDILVAPSFTNQKDDLPFTCCHSYGIGDLPNSSSACMIGNIREERPHQQRWEDLYPASHRTNRFENFVEGRGLKDESGSTSLHKLHDVLLRRNKTQPDDIDMGQLLCQVLHNTEITFTSQPHIHKNDVWFQFLGTKDDVPGPNRGRNDFEIRLLV